MLCSFQILSLAALWVHFTKENALVKAERVVSVLISFNIVTAFRLLINLALGVCLRKRKKFDGSDYLSLEITFSAPPKKAALETITVICSTCLHGQLLHVDRTLA